LAVTPERVEVVVPASATDDEIAAMLHRRGPKFFKLASRCDAKGAPTSR